MRNKPVKIKIKDSDHNIWIRESICLLRISDMWEQFNSWYEEEMKKVKETTLSNVVEMLRNDLVLDDEQFKYIYGQIDDLMDKEIKKRVVTEDEIESIVKDYAKRFMVHYIPGAPAHEHGMKEFAHAIYTKLNSKEEKG